MDEPEKDEEELEGDFDDMLDDDPLLPKGKKIPKDPILDDELGSEEDSLDALIDDELGEADEPYDDVDSDF